MRESIAGIAYRDGKFLIGRRLATGEMGNRWEFPGGKVDEGETPEMALVREFHEEMGIEICPRELLATVEFSNKHGFVKLLAYLVDGIKDTPTILTEHTEVRWVTLEEIPSLSFVDSDLLLMPFLKDWINGT